MFKKGVYGKTSEFYSSKQKIPWNIRIMSAQLIGMTKKNRLRPWITRVHAKTILGFPMLGTPDFSIPWP